MSLIKYNKFVLIVAAFLVFLPMTNSTIIISIGVVAFIFTIAALGLNVVVGWTGLLDLGASGFSALGSYITAILLLNTDIPIVFIFIFSTLIGFFMGILLGIPTLKHKSDYFAILTLGFAELVSLTIRNWTPITGGSYGLSNIPSISFFGHEFKSIPPTGYYYVSFFLLILSFVILYYIRSSKVGKMFHLIKTNEDVAKVYGISPVSTKIIAFGISASIISLSGVLWASYYSSITWSQFDVLLSCIFLSLIIVGGSGNIKGVFIGGLLVTSSIEIIRLILVSNNLPQNFRFFVFAILLILFIRFKPKGLIPDKPIWIKKVPKILKNQITDNSYSKKNISPISFSCSNISKSFDGIKAIDDVSLVIKNSETIGLLGPNGSGKTTLLNIINGLIKQDSGELRLNNKDISFIKPHRRAKLGIRRSFQHNFISEDISIIDNILLPSNKNICNFNLSENFQKLLSSNKIGEQLSFGEKKILDVVRLFSNAPNNSLLLIDEPTSGLDHAESIELVKFITDSHKTIQCSIMVVSHDIKFLENMNLDRILILNHGKVFAEGKLDKLKNERNVQEIFWK
ncbi:MAG: ATP-binding cassette domain-containing protein [Candidatus Kapaibacterium sp.]